MEKLNLPLTKVILAALQKLELESKWGKGGRQVRETPKARKAMRSS